MSPVLVFLIAVTAVAVGLVVGIRIGAQPGAHRPRVRDGAHLRDLDLTTPPRGLPVVREPRHAARDEAAA